MNTPDLAQGSRWQETEVVKFISSLRRLDVTLTEVEERAFEHYALYHARRFALILNAFGVLIPEGAHIFSVGSEPNQLELVLAREFNARVVGSGYNPLDTRDKFTAVYQSSSSWRYEMEMYLRDCSRDPIPAEKESCDLVLCFEVVEHFLNSPASLFREVNRVLRPGGHLLLSTPNLQHWHRLLYWINGVTYPDTDFHLPVESRHTHVFSFRELKELLNMAGLEVVSHFYDDPWQTVTVTPGMPLTSLEQMTRDMLGDREEFQHECIFIAARPIAKAVDLAANFALGEER
jgi:SAM-dependent methyltransferase